VTKIEFVLNMQQRSTTPNQGNKCAITLNQRYRHQNGAPFRDSNDSFLDNVTWIIVC
jgi:hypothetical protein